MRVSVWKPEKKKSYLSDLLGEEYWKWRGKKIFISGPTGMGKTSFVTGNLLNYLRGRGKKLLICCNRKLLRMQYWSSMVEKFVSYAEMEGCVTITTYQQMAETVKRGRSLHKYFEDFEVIICDECHYFYSDSDFNGFGTYALLQEIAFAGAQKELVFMSATMEKVKPLIKQTIRNCLTRLERTGRNTKISEENRQILDYDFSRFADYKRFHCKYLPDMETVCQLLVESQKKTVIFIDDKVKGAELMEQLLKTGKIEKQKIAMLNADNIDEDSDLIRYLAIANRLLPKILITTSVLDNGVSIHDPEVGNVLIITESKTSFVQMLGRIRNENINDCNLYFVRREGKGFLRRMEKYKKEMESFENLTMERLRRDREFFLQIMMENSEDEAIAFYHKALVWMKFDSQFYVWPENECVRLNREHDFYVNEFAKHKIGDMYLAENHFYNLALIDPVEVVYAQMAWLGKAPEELQVMESEYRKTREQEFVKLLLTVQDFSSENLKEFKTKLVKEFRKEFFDDILSNNGTISNGKLKEICKRWGLELVESDAENRRKIYTIKSEEKAEDESC